MVSLFRRRKPTWVFVITLLNSKQDNTFSKKCRRFRCDPYQYLRNQEKKVETILNRKHIRPFVHYEFGPEY